jgi:hypothetical protein
MIKQVRRSLIFFVFVSAFIQALAQSTQKQEDTLTTKTLDPIFVSTYLKNAAPKYIAEVVA